MARVLFIGEVMYSGSVCYIRLSYRSCAFHWRSDVKWIIICMCVFIVKHLMLKWCQSNSCWEVDCVNTSFLSQVSNDDVCHCDLCLCRLQIWFHMLWKQLASSWWTRAIRRLWNISSCWRNSGSKMPRNFAVLLMKPLIRQLSFVLMVCSLPVQAITIHGVVCSYVILKGKFITIGVIDILKNLIEYDILSLN